MFFLFLYQQWTCSRLHHFAVVVLNNLFANYITINLVDDADSLCAAAMCGVSRHHCTVDTAFDTTNNLVVVRNGCFFCLSDLQVRDLLHGR